MNARKSLLLVCCLGATVAPTPAQAPLPSGWIGWARCQIDTQGPGYSHRELHTWTIAGPVPRPADPYQATWSVTGQGSFQQSVRTATKTTQWTVNGGPLAVSLDITVHSDRVEIRKSSATQVARGALSGSELITDNGLQRPSTLAPLDVDEWPFPRSIRDAPASTHITGTSTASFDDLRGPMNPPRGSQRTETCTWDFVKGTAGSASGAVLTQAAAQAASSSPPAIVQAGQQGTIQPVATGASPSPTMTAIPVLIPGEFATTTNLQTLTFTLPTGGHLAALLYDSSKNYYQQIALHLTGTLDWIDRFRPSEIATAPSLPPGQYGTSLLMECLSASPEAVRVELAPILPNATRSTVVKTWNVISSRAPVSFDGAVTLTAPTNGLSWKVSDSFCYFSKLEITAPK